jgi:hypothetical protein
MPDYDPIYPAPAELERAGIAGRNQLKSHPDARELLLPMEDEDAYLQLRANYFTFYQPAGPTEQFLTRELAQLEWRIRRCTRIETNIFNYRFENERWFHRRHVRPGDPVIIPRPPYDKLNQQDRFGEDSRCIGHIYNRDITGDKTTNHLSRYEAGLRKAYFDTLKTLDGQQAVRLKREAAAHQLSGINEPPMTGTAAGQPPKPAGAAAVDTLTTAPAAQPGPVLLKPRRARKNEPRFA